jgi:hypothetical protein
MSNNHKQLRTLLIKRLNALKDLISKSETTYETTNLTLTSIYGKLIYDIFYDEDANTLSYTMTLIMNDLEGGQFARSYSDPDTELIPWSSRSTVVFATARNQHTVFAESMLDFFKQVRRKTHEYYHVLEEFETTYLPRQEA